MQCAIFKKVFAGVWRGEARYKEGGRNPPLDSEWYSITAEIRLDVFRCIKQESNLIEIQRIETARYSNKAYFPGEYFFIFLRN